MTAEMRRCGVTFLIFSNLENFDSALRTPHLQNIQK